MTQKNDDRSGLDSSNQTCLPALERLQNRDEFIGRHIGPDQAQIDEMLASLGLDSLARLIQETVPPDIALQRPLALAAPLNEHAALQKLRQIMADDNPARSFIGLGYYGTLTPPVIQRNVLENPGWYTAYTPYQPEISQGRLECLLNFQQMILDLTAMELANASLLDEATAAAEGMALARRVSRNRSSNRFFVDRHCLPQTLDVVRTRAQHFGFELVVGDLRELGGHDVFGALFQYPDKNGAVQDLSGHIARLHAQGAIAVVAADLMSLVLLKPPGEMQADVVVGSSQRFGVPMAYGGPHAAYFATREEHRRSIPGRLIGVSVDARGNQALRMALQTREQHIRREKANSNICTAQVLLANMAALYAMYHGPQGLHLIAARIHRLTRILAQGLQQQGIALAAQVYFDTLTLCLGEQQAAQVLARARKAGVNLREDAQAEGRIGISLDECSSAEEVKQLWGIVLGDAAKDLSIERLDQAISTVQLPPVIPAQLQRHSAILQHRVFRAYRSETEMLRYLKRLEDRDISLTRSMIPLGSCTMKLNASAEMMPVSWPQFSQVHPFVPLHQVPGYQQMIRELEHMLAEITGFDAVSLQPNSGAQGEYAGLLAIRQYLDSQDKQQRNICLIPRSAHGTNPASATMVGLKVVIVACDASGNVDLDDLQRRAREFSDQLAALMITYPSTHGVYEEGIVEICRIVHEHGGQVYMDGANMNAQVGVTRPGDIGADVAHVNLHKTFCIPHGGGGPGMGPIGVKSHLAPFLPGHRLTSRKSDGLQRSAVSAAPWGSAGILPISWMYLRLMGAPGLLRATQVAILNANYIAARLAPHYPVLYSGRSGRVAHECIIDLRAIKQSCGVTEEDVAKRLMDYGYHAPTMSFPVPGTLMIEPTESESKQELDRFIAALISIRQEIARIEAGQIDAADNPLKQAPHTLADIMDENWDRPYSKQQAAFPAAWLRDSKYWPSVNRVDNVYGDRNLFCACPALEDYT